jgi:hypothetical protein
MLLKCLPNPKSNMRSASSRTKKLTRRKFVAFIFTMSISLPYFQNEIIYVLKTYITIIIIQFYES